MYRRQTDMRLPATPPPSEPPPCRAFFERHGLVFPFFVASFALTTLARVALGFVPVYEGEFNWATELIELLEMQMLLIATWLFSILLPAIIVWLLTAGEELIFGPREREGDEWHM